MPLAKLPDVVLRGVDRRLIKLAKDLARDCELFEDPDVWLWITSGKRTAAQQNALLAAGKTTARGESGPHVQGRALDLNWGDEIGPYERQNISADWWSYLQDFAKARGFQSPQGSSFPGHVQIPLKP